MQGIGGTIGRVCEVVAGVNEKMIILSKACDAHEVHVHGGRHHRVMDGLQCEEREAALQNRFPRDDDPSSDPVRDWHLGILRWVTAFGRSVSQFSVRLRRYVNDRRASTRLAYIHHVRSRSATDLVVITHRVPGSCGPSALVIVHLREVHGYHSVGCHGTPERFSGIQAVAVQYVVAAQ